MHKQAIENCDILINLISFNDRNSTKKLKMLTQIKETLSKDYNTLRIAFTPPTEEEVLKELNKYFPSVIYKNGFFHTQKCGVELKHKGGSVQTIQNNKVWLERIELGMLKNKPHLITLIGRFYQGENKWKNSK